MHIYLPLKIGTYTERANNSHGVRRSLDTVTEVIFEGMNQPCHAVTVGLAARPGWQTTKRGNRCMSLLGV